MANPRGGLVSTDSDLVYPEEGLDLLSVWALAVYQQLPQLVNRPHLGENVTALKLNKIIFELYIKDRLKKNYSCF